MSVRTRARKLVEQLLENGGAAVVFVAAYSLSGDVCYTERLDKELNETEDEFNERVAARLSDFKQFFTGCNFKVDINLRRA